MPWSKNACAVGVGARRARAGSRPVRQAAAAGPAVRASPAGSHAAQVAHRQRQRGREREAARRQRHAADEAAGPPAGRRRRGGVAGLAVGSSGASAVVAGRRVVARSGAGGDARSGSVGQPGRPGTRSAQRDRAGANGGAIPPGGKPRRSRLPRPGATPRAPGHAPGPAPRSAPAEFVIAAPWLRAVPTAVVRTRCRLWCDARRTVHRVYRTSIERRHAAATVPVAEYVAHRHFCNTPARPTASIC